VQVDPIKSTSKAPGTKRLKLKYDKLLWNVAFKFHLRPYSEAALTKKPKKGAAAAAAGGAKRKR